MEIQQHQIASTLFDARARLARGEFEVAGALLQGLAKSVSGKQAMQTAELLLAARLLDDATNLMVAVAREQGDVWSAVYKFAGHMRARGLMDASRRVIGAFIDAHPEQSVERMHADIELALGLPGTYRSAEELSHIRDAYLSQLRALIDSYPPLALREIGARPEDFARDNLNLAYQGGDDLVAQSVYGDWLAESLNQLTVQSPLPHTNNARPTIVFVSSKLHECTVGWYFASWIEHLSRSWDVTLVHTPEARRDRLTQRLATLCRNEIVLSPSIDAAAAQIRALAPSIVLYPELGLDGFTFALAALRLAPVQACAWGHPVTTGLPTIDAFITCAEMEPADAAAHYRERLIGLPGFGTRYATPPIPPAPAPDALGLPNDRTLYLMPQVLHKWHPDTDRHIVEIVRRDPTAGFVMFELRPPSPARLINERLLHALSEVSERPAAHLFWMPECSRTDYLRVNRVCRVMVDTPHWSGGNATVDALSCGVPVVTMPGRFMRGRQSATILRLLSCEELIAGSVEELADIAVEVAHDQARCELLGRKICDRLPSVTQSEVPLLALDASLRNLLAEPSST